MHEICQRPLSAQLPIALHQSAQLLVRRSPEGLSRREVFVLNHFGPVPPDAAREGVLQLDGEAGEEEVESGRVEIEKHRQNVLSFDTHWRIRSAEIRC